MQRDHFDEALLARINHTPFRPFTIALVDGDRVEVDHPNAIAVRDGIALFAAPGGVPVFFDHEGVSRIIGELKHESDN